MSYLKIVDVTKQGTINLTPTRTVSPRTLFDSKQLYNNQSLGWVSSSISASFTYSQNRASTILAVSGTSGSSAVMQSKQRVVYQPGKHTQVLISFVGNETPAGVVKRIGLYDGANGIFFEDSGSSLSLNISSKVTGTPVITRVSQSAWNLNKFDGTGVPPIVLDPTKAQIFASEFQWLGVGQVYVGFVIDNVLLIGHEFSFTNSNTSVFMSTPNLPIRHEMFSLGSANTGSLEQICSSVASEGGESSTGFIHSVNRGITVQSVSNTLISLLSIRMAPSSSQGANVVLDSLNIAPAKDINAVFYWALLYNPVLSGGDTAVWIPVSGSVVQYDISRTNTIADSNMIIDSGYGLTESLKVLQTSDKVLGIDLNGVSDQIVLAVQMSAVAAVNFLGSLSWREIW